MIFETQKKEDINSKIKRLGFNLFPAYKATGAEITFISSDFQEIHIKLGLNILTRNYVGVVFGGSIYGALDPIYMVQLINILGKNYVVWDKSANIKFIRPIKKNVYARFLITDELIENIKSEVHKNKRYDIVLNVHFQDKDGKIFAEVEKTIYIADKKFYTENKSPKLAKP